VEERTSESSGMGAAIAQTAVTAKTIIPTVEVTELMQTSTAAAGEALRQKLGDVIVTPLGGALVIERGL
jgi:hypothetical protein